MPLCTNTTSLESLSVTYDRSMAFSANKTGLHDIPEIVLKVVLNTINQTYKSGVDCDHRPKRIYNGMLCLYIPILQV
jgi:hypothetical protein